MDTGRAAAKLGPWLYRQRWFQGKASTVAGTSVADRALLDGSVLWALVDVQYANRASDRYQLVLAPAAAAGVGDPVRIAGATWVDATADPSVLRPLAVLAAGDGSIVTESGTSIAGTASAARQIPTASRLLGGEQSNTSVVFGDSVILKLIRRLQEGRNPDVELTNVLTAAGNRHVPPQIGALIYGDGHDTALAMVAEFLPDARDGWRSAVDDAVAAGAGHAAATDRPFVGRLTALGAAVASVHATLAERLPTAPATATDVTAWAKAVGRHADEVLASGALPVAVGADALHAAIARAVERVRIPGLRTRTHGDLHLGQVVDSSRGWQVLDFEGEPTRPLTARRALTSPLRDVAGMLRSFDYAAAAALQKRPMAPDDELPTALTAWRDAARRSFLDGYEAGSEQPIDRGLLLLFELEKAIYEVGYERANRPDWLAIPIGGILRILARASSPSTATTRGTPMSGPQWHADPDEVAGLLAGTHRNPHNVLGIHQHTDGTVVRVLRPDIAEVEVVLESGDPIRATRTADGGLFEALLPSKAGAGDYVLRLRTADGTEFEAQDPYAFWPTLGDIDLHLAGEGRHEDLWRRLGAHVTEIDGVKGTSFAVWAPNARSVRVVGSFNDWDGRRHPMRQLDTGIWELFVPDVDAEAYYKYEVLRSDGHLTLHADPFAFWTEKPPQNSSRVFVSDYSWGDQEWMRARPRHAYHREPLSIYEVHLGSWRHSDGDPPANYRELAQQLAEYAKQLGFTHVELLPVAEHPFSGSWGYQVTGHFAPTARFGNPDDFRYLVDHLHQHGIGLIVDWVPAHFPKDEWALAKFDGTALYEHADPRQAEHPDWGTLVFNFGRNEVRNFLLASALFWLEELHVDGLRVDAVASMLYLDYSREEGEWVPNAYGGNENLEAIDFLKQTATTVYSRNPGTLLIAEESTAWPGVSRPVHLGGLGFGFKWNMGWMHDTLSYFSRDPIHRRFHHNELTFGLLYAWSENYVLPLSHDEVVHGKRSLLDKMPGDRWQKFANLRALFGYMWAHPGKQLLFMGGEFGQWREWSENNSLDWYLLDEPDHQGLQQLVGDLNRTYADLPALWQRDTEPEGFGWIDASNADANVLSFSRYATDGTPLVCVVNLSPMPRDDQRFGLPRGGRWRELMNTDAGIYGGGNLGNMGVITAEDVPWHGMTASAQIFIPPLATLWLVPDD